MSEKKIYEGTFQWPTRGEIIFFAIFGVIDIFFIIGMFFEPSIWTVVLIYALIPIAYYLLMSKVRKSLFADVYGDRVESGSAFFRLNRRQIEASKIESVLFHQSLLGKSKYGNVTIGGSGGMRLRVTNIKDPEAFVEAVKGISSAPIKKESATASTSAAKEIADLNSLLQAGVITQEDFEKAKRKVLDN